MGTTMLDNLTCEQKRMLLIAAAAAAGGAGGWYWKRVKGGLGGAAGAGVLAYLLLAQCGPETVGPILSSTPDGSKTTVIAPSGGSKTVKPMPATTTPTRTVPILQATLSKLLPSADAALPVSTSRTVAGNIGGAGAKCQPGYAWSDARGGCVYVPPKVY